MGQFYAIEVDSRPGELKSDRALAAAKRLDTAVANIAAAGGGRPAGAWPFRTPPGRRRPHSWMIAGPLGSSRTGPRISPSRSFTPRGSSHASPTPQLW